MLCKQSKEDWTHYFSSTDANSGTCPVVHAKTQNLQLTLLGSTLTNTLQHDDENDGIALAFLLQSAMVQSHSHRDWAKIQFQLQKLLRLSTVSGYTILSAAEWTLFCKGEQGWTENTALLTGRYKQWIRQTSKPLAMAHNLLAHATSTAHGTPSCWRLLFTESSEVNGVTKPSPVPVAFTNNFS